MDGSMYKRFLRCVSMILVLTMLTEMLPVIGLNLFSQKVAAVDHGPESTYSMPAPAESPSITPAKAPDAIIDKTKLMQSTDPDSIDANRRYITILSGYTRFSQLSPEDAAFLSILQVQNPRLMLRWNSRDSGLTNLLLA